mmetsp:Transcript_31622/g.74682  ORF Transcript_31622/g.74682 Transcript_31622/m.74682 type:complete len:203 (+) Transcript_31622:106-714(+)
MPHGLSKSLAQLADGPWLCPQSLPILCRRRCAYHCDESRVKQPITLITECHSCSRWSIACGRKARWTLASSTKDRPVSPQSRTRGLRCCRKLVATAAPPTGATKYSATLCEIACSITSYLPELPMLRMGSSVSNTGNTVQSMAHRIDAMLETLLSLSNHDVFSVSAAATSSTLSRFGALSLLGALSRFAAASRLATRATERA